MIQIVAPSRYKIDKKILKKSLSQLLLEYGLSDTHLVNVIFVGKNKMKSIAETYSRQEVAHPVLSFPYNDQVNGKRFLGEIFICYPQAVLLAAEKEKRVNAIILKLIEHGLQNLLGD
ncbi:rRNA maturation RNAse YbeY [Candidatus Roizmanbacteria bacterium]|nr:rRNA maturation RNAse YbeY [Candidatus Roizmanbacteria bacterium]